MPNKIYFLMQGPLYSNGERGSCLIMFARLRQKPKMPKLTVEKLEMQEHQLFTVNFDLICSVLLARHEVCTWPTFHQVSTVGKGVRKAGNIKTSAPHHLSNSFHYGWPFPLQQPRPSLPISVGPLKKVIENNRNEQYQISHGSKFYVNTP